MNKIERLVFSSYISDIENVNSSFDKGVLRIAYIGENPNQSSISKTAFENAVPSLFNCPVVCNYNREDNSIGGHDVDIVSDENGEVKIVNITQPVGLVPESADVFWEEYNGHDYLCCEVLLWKRQEAYSKIKEDGIESHSMEITVNDGYLDRDTGLYVILGFEFNALCLLGDGVKPCFADSQLQMFSAKQFKKEISEMMEDLKSTQAVTSSQEDKSNFSSEGGNERLEEKDLKIVEDIEEEKKFDEEDGETEEETTEGEEGNEEGGEEGSGDPEGGSETEPGTDPEDNPGGGSGDSPDPGEDPTPDPPSPPEPPTPVVDDGDDDVVTKKKEFELISNIRGQLIESLESIIYTDEDGRQFTEYWYHDADLDKSEVYALSSVDWKIHGFKFSISGDKVTIDFESKKLMKIALVDFKDGEVSDDTTTFSYIKDRMEKVYEENKSLKEFKKSIEDEAIKAEKNEVLDKFSCLNEYEEYKNLVSDIDKYSAAEIEEKCFAIKGKHDVSMKFSATQKVKIKLPVSEKDTNSSKPYGNLFDKYLNK